MCTRRVRASARLEHAREGREEALRTPYADADGAPRSWQPRNGGTASRRFSSRMARLLGRRRSSRCPAARAWRVRGFPTNAESRARSNSGLQPAAPLGTEATRTLRVREELDECIAHSLDVALIDQLLLSRRARGPWRSLRGGWPRPVRLRRSLRVRPPGFPPGRHPLRENCDAARVDPPRGP